MHNRLLVLRKHLNEPEGISHPPIIDIIEQSAAVGTIPVGANLIFAGPATGSTSLIPTFRKLVANDLANGAETTKYLRGDMTWADLPAGVAYTANNGLTPTGSTFQLGGNLIKHTTIDGQNQFNYTLTGLNEYVVSGNTLTLGGQITATSLTGTGNRMVVANEQGVLGTQSVFSAYNFSEGITHDGSGNVTFGGTLSPDRYGVITINTGGLFGVNNVAGDAQFSLSDGGGSPGFNVQISNANGAYHGQSIDTAGHIYYSGDNTGVNGQLSISNNYVRVEKGRFRVDSLASALAAPATNGSTKMLIVDQDGYFSTQSVSAGDTHLGNTNLTLTGARTVTGGNNSLNFTGVSEYGFTTNNTFSYYKLNDTLNHIEVSANGNTRTYLNQTPAGWYLYQNDENAGNVDTFGWTNGTKLEGGHKVYGLTGYAEMTSYTQTNNAYASINATSYTNATPFSVQANFSKLGIKLQARNATNATYKGIAIGLTGGVTLDSLTGVGNRMVIADSTGLLATTAIPSNTDFATNDLTATGNRTHSFGNYSLAINSTSSIAFNASGSTLSVDDRTLFSNITDGVDTAEFVGNQYDYRFNFKNASDGALLNQYMFSKNTVRFTNLSHGDTASRMVMVTSSGDLGTQAFSANNGISPNGGTFQLGGNLNKNTMINGLDSFNFIFYAINTFQVTGGQFNFNAGAGTNFDGQVSASSLSGTGERMVTANSQGVLSTKPMQNRSVQALVPTGTQYDFDVSLGLNAKITLDGQYYMSIYGALPGDSGFLIINNSTATCALGFDYETNYVENNGTTNPPLTQVAASVDMLKWFYDGTTYYWTVHNNFTTSLLTT